ncbi:MAG: HypC/HybG/HupF family hydrogenase formation chaperone [Nitrososphaerales archaeon]
MCLAIPGRVVEQEGDHAKVDFGGGTSRVVNISLVHVEVGQYVIVHAGFAIQVLNQEEALRSLEAWKELLSSEA